MQTRVYSSFDELPGFYRALSDEAGRTSFYFTESWFRNLAETAMDAGDSLRLYGIERNSPRGPQALALLPTRELRDSREFGRSRVLTGLTAPYTTLFGPMLASPASEIEAICGQFAAAFGAESRRWDVLKFDALDGDAPFHTHLADALRAAGFVTQSHFHFGNWYEKVGGGTADDYLAGRPSILRNTIQRKTRKLDKSGAARFELVSDAEQIEEAITAYETVYAASWKTVEPHPAFAAGLIRAAAPTHALRLGLCFIDDEPAAAQIWIAAGGRATIFKLAYDQRFKKLSLGSILSFWIMRRLIEEDGVQEVDFGRGDDPYKQQWLKKRRERRGVVAFNPRTLRGARGAVRHVVGGKIKSLLKGGASGGPGAEAPG